MGSEHKEEILDQFTRQAVPFATAAAIRNEDALNRIVKMAEAGPNDTVLDVACGPGLLACAFARVARHVTGIDLTPAMLEQARALQRQQGLENITWQEGDVLPLPYADHSFSIVSARFAFHHFLDPLAVLKEMRRVCRPGGRVVVYDSAPAADKADAFNRMERLRDPSHVRALPPEEHRATIRESRSARRLAFNLTVHPETWKVCSRVRFRAKGTPIASARYSPTHWRTTISAWRRSARTARSASRSLL